MKVKRLKEERENQSVNESYSTDPKGNNVETWTIKMERENEQVRSFDYDLVCKPSLDYDLVCKPLKLLSLKKSPSEQMNLSNLENRTLYTTHQILEAWIYVSQQLLKRIGERIDSKEFDRALSDCWLLEKIWKLLNEIEDLHLVMDPDDFLRLKNQLSIKASTQSEAFCFRSRGLVEMTKLSKDLKHKVPQILDVEVDPMGGPRIQEGAMKLYRENEGFVSWLRSSWNLLIFQAWMLPRHFWVIN